MGYLLMYGSCSRKMARLIQRHVPRQSRRFMRRSVELVLLAVGLLASAPTTAARAQSVLPTAYSDQAACGGFWLVPQIDSTVLLHRSRNGPCDRADFITQVTSSAANVVSISVRARATREALRLPLRLFIDLDSIVAVRRGVTGSPGVGRISQLVDGDDGSWLSSLDIHDGWRTAMWRLSDARPDTARVTVLAPDSVTLSRTINLRIPSGDQRPDSLFVHFRLQGLRAAPTPPAQPPVLAADSLLRGVPLVRDTTLFPLPFYDGIVVLRFDRRTGALSRQQVMDRLQGRVIAARPSGGSEPDLIVQVGPAWRDSLKQKDPQRKLSREVRRFGYLLRDQDSVYAIPAKTPVDATVIEAEWPANCHLRADGEVHRRLAMVYLNDATVNERQQIERLFGAHWRVREDNSLPPIFESLEMIGTRDEVNRQIGFMVRLPQVDFAMLDEYFGLSGPVCPETPDSLAGQESALIRAPTGTPSSWLRKSS
jgi:hypothetical protein